MNKEDDTIDKICSKAFSNEQSYFIQPIGHIGNAFYSPQPPTLGGSHAWQAVRNMGNIDATLTCLLTYADEGPKSKGVDFIEDE